MFVFLMISVPGTLMLQITVRFGVTERDIFYDLLFIILSLFNFICLFSMIL